MEKLGFSVQQQRWEKEVVEDIMIKKKIKPADSSVKELISGSVNTMKKDVYPEGSFMKVLEKLFRKSWQNVRHVEAAEIDAVFSPELQPLESNNIEFSATTQLQKRDSGVSKKEVELEVDEIDAVFYRELQSKTTKPKKPRLNQNAKLTLLGGGGHFKTENTPS